MAAPAEGQEGIQRFELSVPAARSGRSARSTVLALAHIVLLALRLTGHETAVVWYGPLGRFGILS